MNIESTVKGTKTMSNETTVSAAVETAAVSTDSTSTDSKKGKKSMKRNRNRTTKRDVNLSSLGDLFASVSRNAEKDLASSDEQTRENERKGQRTYAQVCETFEGLNEYLDSIITQLLTCAGVLDAETMLRVKKLDDREAWVRQTSAHKGGVALMKAMLNRVPARDEDGNKIILTEGPYAGKPKLVREGTYTLPGFNDKSEDAPHAGKPFTTTECAAIHSTFWKKWEQHPVASAIIAQHDEHKSSNPQRQIDSANRGKRDGAKQFTVEQVASDAEARELAERERSTEAGGYKVLSAKLEGVKASHQLVTPSTGPNAGKTYKRRIPRSTKSTPDASAPAKE